MKPDRDPDPDMPWLLEILALAFWSVLWGIASAVQWVLRPFRKGGRK